MLHAFNLHLGPLLSCTPETVLRSNTSCKTLDPAGDAWKIAQSHTLYCRICACAVCRVSVWALQVFCIAAVCGFALVAILFIRPHNFSWADALAATGGDVASARALALQKVCALHKLFTQFSTWKIVFEVCIQDVSSSHTQALSDCWTSTFANDRAYAEMAHFCFFLHAHMLLYQTSLCSPQFSPLFNVSRLLSSSQFPPI